MQPIEWDMHKSHIIAGILSECEGIPPLGMIDKAVARAKYPGLKLHLYKLRDDLTEWEPRKAKYAPGAKDIILRSLTLGPDFFSEYKKDRRDAMYHGVGAYDPITGERMYKPDPDYWSGPDSWFDMRFTIFWELESDDHKYMFSEGSEEAITDLEYMESFSFAVLSVIPNDISIEEDVLGTYYPGSAKSYDPSVPDKKRVPEWLECYGEDYLDDGPPIPKVKGVQIPKCAGETRDGVTIPPTTKRLLTKVGKAISQLIRKGPYSKRHPTGMTYDQVKGKLSHLDQKYAWFLCLDFEKIGISLPIPIIIATLEACYEVTGYDPFQEAIELFRGMEYHNGSEYAKVLRGYCLGLFNEGMTLVQLALHYLVCEEISADRDGMFLNDDGVVAFTTQDEAMAYAEADSTTCLALGIPRKDEKSFLARGFFVFCEEYYNEGLLPKKTVRDCAYNSCYYVSNIRVAKELFSSISLSMGLDEDKLAPLIEYWGYELYEDEYLSPYEFGGWYHFISQGVNVCLTYYDRSFDMYWGYHAISQRLAHKGKVGKKPTQPLSRIINALKIEPDDEIDHEAKIKLEDLFGDRRAIAFYRGQTDTGRDNHQFFHRIKARRVKEFFDKHRREIPPDDLSLLLTSKGYIPDLRSVKLSNHEELIFSKWERSEECSISNAELVLSLRKIGADYNHPSLNHITPEMAKDAILDAILKEHNVVPLDGLMSIEPTESNIKLCSYLYKNYSSFPSLELKSRDLAFKAVFGWIPSKVDQDRFLDLIDEETIEQLTEIKEILVKLIRITEATPPLEEEMPSQNTTPAPTRRFVRVVESTANSSGNEEDVARLSSRSRFIEFDKDTPDHVIALHCANIGVIPLGLDLGDEDEPDDNEYNPFSNDPEEGDY
jgi:hypothetical protein